MKGDYKMSMPKIPDLKNLTYEQSINLLLTSIAMEEISLSKLMDAESEKIKHAVEKFSCEPENILSINQSVNATMINMIKMQMLLQFKLENVERMIPHEHPPIKRCCNLIGEGKGSKCDERCGKSIAILCARENKSILYSVENCCDCRLKFICHPKNSHIKCPDHCDLHKIIIQGKGNFTDYFKDNECILNDAEFKLIVHDKNHCKPGFHMVIKSIDKEFFHDSGFIHTKPCDTTLTIVDCDM